MGRVRHIGFNADPADPLQDVHEQPIAEEHESRNIQAPDEWTEESEHRLDFRSWVQDEEAAHDAGDGATCADDNARICDGADRVAEHNMRQRRQDAGKTGKPGRT